MVCFVVKNVVAFCIALGLHYLCDMKQLLAYIAVAAVLTACSAAADKPWWEQLEKSRYATPVAEVSPTADAAELAAAGFDTTVHTVAVRNIGALRTAFNDTNDTHLAAAIRTGISPISTLADVWKITRPIVRIASCNDYYVDSMTHSLPYLTPEADALLHDIGRSFADTIAARSGGHRYLVKVTSALRTEASVAALRRRNRNATDSSAHRFATTFDLSYTKFIQCDPNYRISQESLKNVLAEVLADLRERERCYVKYERKTSCFHITVR